MTYAKLSREHRKLKKVPYDYQDGSKNDAYWMAIEAFKVRLRAAMSDDDLLRKLTKPQLLKVIQWCSGYRPIEPHIVLSTLGRLVG